MGTGKCHTGQSLMNREMWKHVSVSFGEELLSIGIDVLMRYHTEGTGRHSARTEAVYDEWIPSNGVIEKCLVLAICSSVWRRSFRTHSDTNVAFSAFREVESRPTRLLYTGVQNLSNNVKIWQIAMKLQKRRSGDQYSEQVSQ
ncbi:hypothetical protein TNCV_4634201 [Trichonephila clavipes]|nr:hypothetical protein TNCV_4634201 [Trichonephila clavipes]